MSLFKKKERAEQPSCCCGGEIKTVEANSVTIEGKLNIKVLGSGCASCHALYENACKAVEEAGFDTEVEYITDMEKIMSYGVMSMPALVVNEKVVSVGKVLKSADIQKLLASC